MDDARGGADFFIGESSDVLLKKVDEPAFALEGGEQVEGRCMLAFGRKRNWAGRRGRRNRLNGRGKRPPGELGIEDNSQRQS